MEWVKLLILLGPLEQEIYQINEKEWDLGCVCVRYNATSLLAPLSHMYLWSVMICFMSWSQVKVKRMLYRMKAEGKKKYV